MNMQSLRAQLSQPLSWLVAALSLAPLAIIALQAVTDTLTANPVQAATIRTGKIALILLVISLACTPVNKLLGWRWPLKIKRATGIYGWLYVAVHLGIFVYDNGYLEGAIDLMSVYTATFDKRFALIGFVAFVLLTPLMVTSSKAWQKRLGKRWKSLHKLVYVAVPLGVLHFALLVKSISGRPEPVIWGVVVGILLLVRLKAVKSRSMGARGGSRSAAVAASRAPKPPMNSEGPTRSA
jgi:sulfoxide reductase heme-binding subunit YedZ